MSDQSKNPVHANNQVQMPDNTDEIKKKEAGTSTNTNPFAKDMPTVTTLLARKKLSSSSTKTGEQSPVMRAKDALQEKVDEVKKIDTQLTVTPMANAPLQNVPVSVTTTNSHNVRPGVSTAVVSSVSIPGSNSQSSMATPPTFRSTLVLSPINFKKFKARIAKYKKLGSFKKLACLEYFVSRYTEIAYFELNDAAQFGGVVGFGSIELVSNIPSHFLNLQSMPSLGDIISSGEFFTGPPAGLRDEDTNALGQIGFSGGESLGVFPIVCSKKTKGVWICLGKQTPDIHEKELKALKKVFTDLEFPEFYLDASAPFYLKIVQKIQNLFRHK